MGFLRWLVSIWLRFRLWSARERDYLAEKSRQERRHRDECDELRAQIKIKDETIASMAEMIEQLRSITKANLALNNRTIAEATIGRSNE